MRCNAIRQLLIILGVLTWVSGSLGTGASQPGRSARTSLAEPPTDGLIGYWPFNGNANDESGDGHDGTISGGVISAEDRFGNPNSAFDFDGLTGEISVAHDEILWYTGEDSLTISCWVNLETIVDGGGILCKGEDVSDYCLWVNANGNLFASVNHHHPSHSSVMADSVLVTGRWYHVLVGFDRFDVAIHINGGPATTGTFTADPTLEEVPLYIGNDADGADERHDGLIDDIRIYDRVLTEDEIEALWLESTQQVPHEVLLELDNPGPIHPGDSVTLRASLLDDAGNRLLDSGDPLTLTSLNGCGTITTPVEQTDSTYTAIYEATSACLDLIELHDPEATSAPRDTVDLIITSILDVGNDQGRQVRVTWLRDLLDDPSSEMPVVEYTVWRRVDELPQIVPLDLASSPHPCPMTRKRETVARMAFGGDLWEPVGGRHLLNRTDTPVLEALMEVGLVVLDVGLSLLAGGAACVSTMVSRRWIS